MHQQYLRNRHQEWIEAHSYIGRLFKPIVEIQDMVLMGAWFSLHDKTYTGDNGAGEIINWVSSVFLAATEVLILPV